MRWNYTLTLLANTERYQDEDGAWHEGKPTKRKIFCNERKYGSIFMGNLRSNDIRMLNNNLKVDVGQMPEAQIEVRTAEYRGEPECIFKGQRYIVLYVTINGDNSILGLVRRIGNV